MSFRQILPLAVLVTACLPASALAATATVTGDDGNPVALSTTAPISIRNMDVTTEVTVATAEATYYTSQVFDAAGTPASSLASCRTTRFSPTAKNFVDYRGNGTYTLLLRYFASADSNCTGTANESQPSSTRSTPAPRSPHRPSGCSRGCRTRSLTRTHQIPVALNPGAIIYEVRYARGGVAGPRRRDLRPLGGDVREPHHRARGLPVRQARALADRRAREVGDLLHPVERAGERQRDRAVRPRGRHVPRRPRPELQAARSGP